MAQYLLSVYFDYNAPLPDEAEMAQIYKEVDVVNEEIKAAGAWVFGGGLHPASTATVVRANDGDVLTTDGPYVDLKESLGGFWVIQADDLDAALAWAEKVVEATNHDIEVRPFRGTGRLRDQMGL